MGLKGTDGDAILAEAMRRGAVPTASSRMDEAMASLDLDGIEVLSIGNGMGAAILDKLRIENKVVYQPTEPTNSEDTKTACRVFLEAKVDLIVFGGGMEQPETF